MNSVTSRAVLDMRQPIEKQTDRGLFAQSKNCYSSEKDPSIALLNYKGTPLANGYSPAKYKYNY